MPETETEASHVPQPSTALPEMETEASHVPQPSTALPVSVSGLLSLLEHSCLQDDTIISVSKGTLVHILHSGIGIPLFLPQLFAAYL